MILGEYQSIIYQDIEYMLKDNINISDDDLKRFYESGLIRIPVLKNQDQIFAHKISKQVDLNLCKLKQCKWVWDAKATWSEPKLHYNYIKHFNWGDFSSYDGDYNISVSDYKINITIRKEKQETSYNDSIWEFEFDKNNEDSINSFYNIFRNILYEEYIKLLIHIRVSEINENERKRLLEIHKNLITNDLNK